MLKFLEENAKAISELIIHDDYPATIKPEYLRAAVIDYPGRGGKRLRPALLLLCCGLLGGDTKKALYPAAATEIYHNWTLVHDDIIDNDNFRRGMLTTHCEITNYAKEKFHVEGDAAKKFGRDLAILAGDIQQGWAVNTMLKAAGHGVSPEVTLALTRRLQELVNRELISGEALDVEFPLRGRHCVTTAEVSEMLYLKTGALLRFCAEAGAAIALNTTDFKHKDICSLGEFAAAAGCAFQLRDDWLGIFGDFEKLGKRIGSDLTESKPTILLLKSFEMLKSDARTELEELIGLEKYSTEQIAKVRELMTACGAEEYVLEQAEELAAEARKTLAAFPDNKHRQYLLELTDYLTGRNI